MKRFFCSLLALLVLITTLAVPAFAVDDSRKFEFSLSVDGKTEKYVSTGDVISVTFTLKRTDADEEYAIDSDDVVYESGSVSTGGLTNKGVVYEDPETGDLYIIEN